MKSYRDTLPWQSRACLFGLACSIAFPAAALGQDAVPPPAPIAGGQTPNQAGPKCRADLTSTGGMADVLSNVLLRVEGKSDGEVKAFLGVARQKSRTGNELLAAAAEHFKIDQTRLASVVEQWRHINCWHEPIPGYVNPEGEPPLPTVSVSPFAADVTLHVVFHELGHAVIREFDLMVLGNEETMADAFATHLLTEHFPEQAVGVISARARSLMIEAEEVPRDQWPVRGEHDNDARRAFQIAALAVAADKEKYACVAEIVGMSPQDIRKACDYGADIHRAWRRTLAPLMMPAGKASKEAAFTADDAMQDFARKGEPSVEDLIRSAIGRFDWHSKVTVSFVGGDGGAAWSRSTRTITVNGEYLRRFVAQGEKASAQAPAREPAAP
jgi:hypothetical protein